MVALTSFDADLRQALIVSLVYSLLTLSTVVVTGYVGQISLAQMAFAGVAGFTTIEVADNGLPFPLAVLVAVGVATGVGLVVGAPALRVRGMSLAVATMASAVAIEQLVLGSSALSGGVGGRSAPRPYLFGLDVGISAPGAENFRPAFGATVLVVLVIACVVVANLRRNRTGLRWLAVRSNERAAAAAGIAEGVMAILALDSMTGQMLTLDGGEHGGAEAPVACADGEKQGVLGHQRWRAPADAIGG